jgi:hypothetical protein
MKKFINELYKNPVFSTGAVGVATVLAVNTLPLFYLGFVGLYAIGAGVAYTYKPAVKVEVKAIEAEVEETDVEQYINRGKDGE